jgi:hypothetical protein
VALEGGADGLQRSVASSEQRPGAETEAAARHKEHGFGSGASGSIFVLIGLFDLDSRQLD